MSGYLPERSLLLSHWMSSRPPKRSVSPVAQASCLSPGGLSAYLLCFFTVTSCLIPPTPTICSCVMGLFCCLEWGALSLSCHDFGYFLLLFCLKFILSFTSFLVSHLVCTDYTLLLSISLSPPQHLNFWFSCMFVHFFLSCYSRVFQGHNDPSFARGTWARKGEHAKIFSQLAAWHWAGTLEDKRFHPHPHAYIQITRLHTAEAFPDISHINNAKSDNTTKFSLKVWGTPHLFIVY